MNLNLPILESIFFANISHKNGSAFIIHTQGIPKRIGLGFSLISRDGGSEKDKFISCSSIGVLTGLPNSQTGP